MYSTARLPGRFYFLYCGTQSHFLFIFLCILLVFGFFLPDADQNNYKNCSCRQNNSHDHIDRNSGVSDIQLIRADCFNPGSSDPIPGKIQEKDFSLESAMLQKQKQKNQETEVPQAFI